MMFCILPVLGCSFDQENQSESIDLKTEMAVNRCEPIISSGITRAGTQLIWLIKNTGTVACPMATNGVYTELIRCNRPQPGGQNYNCVVKSKTSFDLAAQGSNGSVKSMLVPLPECSGPGALFSPNGQVLRARLSWHYAGSPTQQFLWGKDYNCF